jgi:hypothetical protein
MDELAKNGQVILTDQVIHIPENVKRQDAPKPTKTVKKSSDANAKTDESSDDAELDDNTQINVNVDDLIVDAKSKSGKASKGPKGGK